MTPVRVTGEDVLHSAYSDALFAGTLMMSAGPSAVTRFGTTEGLTLGQGGRSGSLYYQSLSVATSDAFANRALNAGFTEAQINQLPSALEEYGAGLQWSFGQNLADANRFTISPLGFSTVEGRISHELGHVLDDIARPGLFETAADAGPNFGFSDFYRAESTAYRLQYGFNPIPLAAFNAGMQSNPYLTIGITAAGAAGASYLLRDPLSDLFAPLFTSSGTSSGITLGKKP